MSDEHQEDSESAALPPPPEYFAPELFQSTENESMSQAKLASLALDAEFTLEANQQGQLEGQFGLTIPEEDMKRESLDVAQNLYGSTVSNDDYMESSSIGHDHDRQTSITSTMRDSPNDSKLKSSKHSSKNEGQHTDRRYLCYICYKLFTRRRSVRDHISKIHNTKTWEPVRSLEIIVEPTTGEPIEPVEVTVARGPPAPAKPEKSIRKEKTITKEEQNPTEEPVSHEPDENTLAEVEAIPSPATIFIKEELATQPSRPSSSEPFTAPAPVIGKKRPNQVDGVKSSAVSKKGTAKVKSTPNKRLKISETESVIMGSSAFRSPSGTPVSSQRTPVSKLKTQASANSSPTPESSRAVSPDPASPSPSTSDADSSNDDGEIFCICRKGDNHTWMIACDGGCDEWFHGNCVNIRERDGDLIDKYVCPNCRHDGFQTTWKRMCRRKGCRKPARVLQDAPSKYCSKECGRMFFVELVRRGDPWIDTIKNGQFIVESGRQKKLRKKRGVKERVPKGIPMTNGEIGELINDGSRLATPAYSEDEKSEYETDSSADENMLPNRGGALRAGEVKALIEQCKTIDQWKELGHKPVTPPREVTEGAEVDYDDFEQQKLENMKKQMIELEKRSNMLSSRDTFLELIKTRSASITDEMKTTNPKLKDLCGFDPRVIWSEEEFSDWIDNQQGSTILESGRIGAPPDEVDQPNMINGADDDHDSDDVEDEKRPTKGGICVRNRCSRHRNWAKGQLAELRFDQDVVRRNIARLEFQAREIKDRAILRDWENSAQ